MILESNIKFTPGLSPRKQTKRIVIHHSDSGKNTTVFDIDAWHRAKGWSGIGYHYVIYPDGSIYRGRPENMIGAHAYQDSQHEANSDGIGICLIGKLETERLTTMQLSSLVWLIQNIRTRYPRIPAIGHKDVLPTACPGSNFPWAELNQRLDENNMIRYEMVTDVPQWGQEVVNKLIAKGALAGDGSGKIDLSLDMLRVLVINDRLGLYGE